MKRISFFLLLAAAIAIVGCQKEQLSNTDLLSQDEVTLKHDPVEITGMSTPVGTIDPGTMKFLPNGMVLWTGLIAEWYENPDPDDPYYRGQSIWYETWLISADGQSAKVWGKTDLNLDNNMGKWQLSWHGYVYAYEGYDLRDGIVPCTADCFVKGQGKSGEVKGMVSTVDYTMDFNGDPLTFYWAFSGTYH